MKIYKNYIIEKLKFYKNPNPNQGRTSNLNQKDHIINDQFQSIHSSHESKIIITSSCIIKHVPFNMQKLNHIQKTILLNIKFNQRL